MPAILENQNLGDLLKFEAPQLYSRDTVTVAAGSNLRLGAVVAFTPAVVLAVNAFAYALRGWAEKRWG